MASAEDNREAARGKRRGRTAEDVVDAAVVAINEAMVSDFFSFVSAEDIATQLSGKTRLSAATIRRHFTSGDEELSWHERLTKALVAGVLPRMMPIEFAHATLTRPVSGREVLRAFIDWGYDDRAGTTEAVGVDSAVLAALAGADSDRLVADAVKALIAVIGAWLETAIDAPDSALRALALSALRATDAACWRGSVLAERDPVAWLNVNTTLMERLVPPALLAETALWPSVSLQSAARLLFSRSDPRHEAMMAAAYAVVAQARLGDYLAFLTPARIQSCMARPVDRTTIVYHLRDGASGTRLSVPALISTIQARLNLVDALAVADRAPSLALGLAGATEMPEVDAKRRLALLSYAARDYSSIPRISPLEMANDFGIDTVRREDLEAFLERSRRIYEIRTCLGIGSYDRRLVPVVETLLTRSWSGLWPAVEALPSEFWDELARRMTSR